MNWIIKGKQDSQPVTLHVVGGADTREGVVEGLRGSHPEFVPETFANADALDAALPVDATDDNEGKHDEP